MTDERLRVGVPHARRAGEKTTSTEQKTEFRKKLDALIGQPTGGSGKPTVAPDPVNQPMIRHWAHALSDMNPVYLDPDFAAKSRFGGIVSPPVMLQAWTMPAPKIEGIAERAREHVRHLVAQPQRREEGSLYSEPVATR